MSALFIVFLKIMAISLRTCCACGKKIPKKEMNRFVWIKGMVQVDPGQFLPGRGAYCCADEQCWTLFFKLEKKWKRLFRL